MKAITCGIVSPLLASAPRITTWQRYRYRRELKAAKIIDLVPSELRGAGGHRAGRCPRVRLASQPPMSGSIDQFEKLTL